MNTKFNILWIIIFFVYIAACKPEIETFKANPSRLCEGQTTTLSWESKGDTILNASPSIVGTGAVHNTASAGFKPIKDTTFKLTATRGGKNAYAEQDVLVFSNEKEKEIVIRTKPDGHGGLLAIETLKPEVWDEMIRIKSISNLSGRSIQVTHEGKSITLSGDGTPSTELKGQKMSGTWGLRANLLSGEVIGDPSQPPPDRLRMLITLSCVNSEE